MHGFYSLNYKYLAVNNSQTSDPNPFTLPSVGIDPN